jgi:hypothetical protein
MSATSQKPTTGNAPRISWLAIASLLCGLAVPIIGLLALVDVGSDFSDLLTLTIPPFFLFSLVFCILAHWVILKAPEHLAGKGIAKAGPVGVLSVGLLVWLLIPAG